MVREGNQAARGLPEASGSSRYTGAASRLRELAQQRSEARARATPARTSASARERPPRSAYTARVNDRSLDIAQDGDLFPRDRIAEAVADADWRERRLPWAALAALALGVTLLVWATPVARPLVAQDVVATLDAATRVTEPVGGLARWLSREARGPEAAWSWIQGVAAGSALVLLVGMARRIVGPRLALAAGLAAALAPLYVIGTRLPCRGWVEGALATWLLGRALGADRAAGVRLRLGPSLVVFSAWCASSLQLAALAAVLLAIGPAHLRAERGPRGALAVIALAAVVATIVRRELAVRAFDPVLAQLTPGIAGLALGVAPSLVVCLALFARGSNAAEEAPAPLWLRTAACAVVATIALSAMFGLPWTGTALVPLAALGLANLANRRTDPRAALSLVVGAAVMALAASAALELALRRWDRSRVAAISSALQGGERLAPEALDAEARYLLRIRFAAQPADVLAR